MQAPVLLPHQKDCHCFESQVESDSSKNEHHPSRIPVFKSTLAPHILGHMAGKQLSITKNIEALV